MNARPGLEMMTSAATRRSFADVVGLTAMARGLRRRWKVMLLVGLIGACGLFAFIMSGPRTYSAAALLIITPRQATQEASGTTASAAIDSEIELLRSASLMNDVAEAVGLRRTGEGVGRSNAATADVVNSIARAITITRRGATNVIEISARASNNLRAQQLANSYADVYIANQLRAHVDSSQQASSWLARRLAELRDAVETKEAAAEAYRVQARLPADNAAATPAADVQGNDPQSQVQLARADLDERQARARRLQDAVSSGASLDAIAAAASSDTLNSLRDRMADVDRRQADLENRYLPSHPAVIAIREERQSVEDQVQHEIQRATSALNAQVAAARTRLQTLQRSLPPPAPPPAPADAAISGVDAMAHYRDLQREAGIARQIYETYLQRNQDMADINQLNIPDTRVLAYAPVPTSPTSPNLLLALELAAALGLLLALLTGFGFEAADQSVKNGDDLEERIGYPAVVSIPTISRRMMRMMPPAERHPSGYLIGRPMSAFAEALRVLRTVIVYSKLDKPVQVVAVTSALPGEGKTTISMCLARISALSGQRVCVVDCDLRMQSINDVIDIETDVGILQVLAGEAPWRSAIVNDPSSDAHVLPVARAGFTPRDVFGSNAMARLIDDLRGAYDLVILDCAPILAVAETRILVKQADTTVLVARAGRTPVKALRAAAQQTVLADGHVLGVALNCVLPHWQTYADSLYFDQAKSYYSVG
ncbi:MAG: AAA family ATPase [Proteobacteria bacterium]|nr:AAA family ATPase [Pseudomonadota bacterium]